MSLGGYLAARAVAFEHRFQAAIFFDGVFDLSKSFEATFPKEAIDAFNAGDTKQFEEILNKAMPNDTNLRWTVTQGMWTFGAKSITEFFTESKKMTTEGIAGNIQCPCLVLEAGADMFFKGQPEQIYNQLKVPKKLFPFTAEDGAENHCQSGAVSFKDEVVYNWLDNIFGLNTAAR